MQLGEGAKGVLWFRYMTPGNMENTYRNDFEKMRKRIAELKKQGKMRDWIKDLRLDEFDLDAAFVQYRKLWAETWEAMKEMNAEMCMLRPILSRGYMYPQVYVESASNRGKIYLSGIASDRAVVLFAVNLDYDFDPQGYRFKPQRDVRLTVEIPEWLKTADSDWIIKGEKMTPAEIQQTAGKITVELKSLLDGGIILIGEKRLAESMTPDTKSLLP
jgi:hypothetical protein